MQQGNRGFPPLALGILTTGNHLFNLSYGKHLKQLEPWPLATLLEVLTADG
ncbi:hypothetical protein LYNGBM3L_14740 [Moorena producens 3L]|uniref:Uncharacterized protein n=1 Tax=Moorena producens 3L TaxID=489825 RepID=F4XLF1_9CYAN|nr:hypothetical protein LYNGBM3L_14740 [Moorena producens 3L]